jgi:hypothetical protein
MKQLFEDLLGWTFEDLLGWTFEIDEVSANVYEVTGKDGAGRSVLVKGTDPDALLEDARQSAKKTREVSR